MEESDGKQNKNALIAIVLSAFVLFGWNYLFPTPTYDTSKKDIVTNDSLEKEVGATPNIGASVVEVTEPAQKIQTQLFSLTSDKGTVTLDQNLSLVDYSFENTTEPLASIFPKYKHVFFVKMGEKVVKPIFEIKKISNTEFSLSATNVDLKGNANLNTQGQLEVKLRSNQAFWAVNELSSEEKSQDQRINNFVYLTDELNTVAVGEDEIDEKAGAAIKWFGIDFNYHLLAFINPKGAIFKAQGKNGNLKVINATASNEANFKVTFLKKNYDDLKGLGDNLHVAVDFGIWSIIALPMLRGLQLFYGFFQNWGLAIIFLTIVIRMLMFPLQHSSFKSMKKMQVLQPELQKIREKYKEDPQKMQQETMAIFKKHGANPVGGCLPLFLQMPIFFAFYRMLYNSVELVDAPFYFWIMDLSEKDPYYVLPVLMGIAMFFNMKLTPNTSMDPAQQKMMMFMPVIFSAFMFTLPSGLNLYILVSTLVGMAQQIFVYKRTPVKA